MRRPALRHGDADDQRGVRTHLGRARRPGAGRGLLAGADRRGSRRAHPDLLFIAEAYWDMEWTLQQQGFDLCYDKRLYDRLVARVRRGGARRTCRPTAAYQERLIRFIENHDEPRAAATFGAGQARAAAVVMSTLQGARLYHDGQLEGLRDAHPGVPGPRTRRAGRRGPARVLRAPAARGRRLGPARRRLGAVRLQRAGRTTTPIASSSRGAGRARLAPPGGGQPVRRPGAGAGAPARGTTCGRALAAERPLSGTAFSATATSWLSEGLYVGLDRWASHFLAFAPHPVGVMPAAAAAETVSM